VIDAKVEPPKRLDKLPSDLRDLGGEELDRKLRKGLNRAASELEADLRRSAVRRLPRRGGLGARVARAKLATRRPVSGGTTGVTVTATGMAQLAAMDAGMVTHPVFGNLNNWVTQRITGGWFSDPAEAIRGETEAAVSGVLDDRAREVARKHGS
jgi:hypothetical protein